MKTHSNGADIAAKHGKTVAILVDLQGPKIRIGVLKIKKLHLKEGQAFYSRYSLWMKMQVMKQLCRLRYKNLPSDVRPGDTLLLR